jgi:hypothetical protein
MPCVITFHENIYVAIWHHIQPFVSFTCDWYNWFFLNDILESHAMNYAECKFDA